jgi:hypothetical protein
MEAGGDITVTGTIATYMRAAIGYGTNSGDIAISTTAGDVKLHNINSANKQTGKFRAGHLSVTAGGSIEIDGTINLRSERGNAYCGNLVLQAGNGKAITLNNLDFGNVNIVSFSGANGTFDITGEIANFDDTATSGTGAKNDPLVTTQTKLRIPAGQIVYYVYEAGVLNDALDGLAYRVADLGGTSGAGGILCAHRPAPGTLLLIK